MVGRRRSTAVAACSILVFVALGLVNAQNTPPPNLFAPAPGNSFPAGPNPRVVVAGDFNGDQISDIAVVNPYTNQISILLGTLTGAPIEPAKAFPTGNLPSAAAAGYFVTGSSNLCLAVTNLEDNNVSVFIGNGDGTFALPAATVPVGNAPIAIAVGDFDQDGNIDLAIANADDNSITVLFGNGKGGFPLSRAQVVKVGSRPISIAVGNFGGFPGMAVANQMDGTVTVISAIGNGTGSVALVTRGPFAVLPGPMNPPYPYPSAVAVADFNGDGYPDIVTANDGTNNVSVLLADGLGGFVPAVGSPIPVGMNPIAVTAADFSDDGNQDLAVANYSSGTVTVLMGTGSGTFKAAAGSPYASGESPASLAVGDFNGTSRPSLAVANEGDNTVTVLLNQVVPPLSVVSGASLSAPVSPGSVITILGSGLASGTMTPPFNALPYTLDGASVVITYSNGMQDVLPLSLVSPTRINAVIPASPPAGASPAPGAINPFLGLATVTVVSPTKVLTSPVEIAQYAPALFSASQNGKGVAQATFTNALFQTTNAYQCTSPTVCLPLPLDLTGGGTLTLNATGLNNAKNVIVTVGSESASVPPVPTTIPGVYQLVVPLTANPETTGLVPVMLSMAPSNISAPPTTSNIVTVLIQ